MTEHLGAGARRLAAEQGRDRPPQGVVYSWPAPATVTEINAGVVTVAYQGAEQDVAYIGDIPTVGDVVVLLVTSNGALLILGKPAGTPT